MDSDGLFADYFFNHMCSCPRHHRYEQHNIFKFSAVSLPPNVKHVPSILSAAGADLDHLAQAAAASLVSAGETQPHPNAACIIVDRSGSMVATASLWAQGTEAPEVAAVRSAGAAAVGGTAYLNLETGSCDGDAAGVRALLASGITRVVVGLRHPLASHRGSAIGALQSGGLEVVVLGENPCDNVALAEIAAVSDAVLLANEPLLHRAVLGRPMGVLKYAMTLDGKIAATSGHSAWVSSKESRQVVFETRARSDAVIVGGQTVRRDNPRLTTRRDGGHQPVRIVMSRTLDLPANAALWDVAHAPTIVATQQGARREFQRVLRSRGVEVLEFDFLTPDALAEYCFQRGFLSLLWECGGMLAAPAISGGAVHKVMAFVAPKIIGGVKAPTPVGDLGFVEMTQAVAVVEPTWRQVGPDLMITGYLPKSGGPRGLAEMLKTPQETADGGSASSSAKNTEFYKSWDKFGALSNFTPHPVALPDCPMTHLALETFQPDQNNASIHENYRVWPSTEHYYQAQKFAGVESPEAQAVIEEIAAAASPEAAAALGRRHERTRPELVREDWSRSKTAAMHAGLRAKFAAHPEPRRLLLSTARATGSIVEAAPHDYFWGRGFDGSGQNMLGRLLETVRDELLYSGVLKNTDSMNQRIE